MEAEKGECLGQFKPQDKMIIPECKLTPKNNVTIKRTYGMAFSLTGSNLPRFNGTKQSVLDLIDYLDVEKSPRYQPIIGATYCNIYAHDYADLMGAYIPRTWWTDKAIKEMDFIPKYGVTCVELNANSLYEWFDKYGIDHFGWRKLKDVTEAQNEANNNKCVIMVAANKDKKRSGHIVAVVPENETNYSVGARSVVVYPLQSQAGIKNKKYFASKWWQGMEELKIYVKD